MIRIPGQLSGERTESRVGTVEKTVIPRRSSVRGRSGPDRIKSRDAGTSAAPAKKAIQISSTLASKAGENPCNTLSVGTVLYL